MTRPWQILAATLIACTVSSAQTVSTIVSNSTFNDGLALDAAGNIYASLYYGTTVTKITPTGQASIFAGGLSSPNGITFGPNGDLYVPNASGSSISKITPAGTSSTLLTITDPATLMFNSDGSLLVTHYNLNKISLVDTNLGVSDFLSGGLLNGPIGLVRDGQGVLYIGNFNDGKIFRYVPGTGLQEIGDIPGWLGFMTLSGNAIYATGWQDNRIYKVPLNGSGAVVFAGTGVAGNADGPVATATFNNPNGIVATAGGDTIYISDYTSRSLRMIVGVNSTTHVGQESALPVAFRLDENYPNPFNPSTTIKFRIPVSGHVTLKVYDLLGREVQVLVNELLEAGSFETKFDALNLASGVYFYRLQSGNFVSLRKMLLTK
ncbi:MAG: T9SS type A sorting domain-containing protein [Bacteroidetes bacterium]|nr:T9SS type A sorting domain-containing protein [Bacteroidota bacterium]MCW5894165.1 T9SS type A sorting domain-containing protein [Bacteroidota bacterium]